MRLSPGQVVALSSTFSALVGITAGAVGMKLHLEKMYDERLGEELVQAKKYYDRLNKRGEFASPVDLAVAEGMLEDLQYISEAVDAVDDELQLSQMTEVVKNVFTDAKTVDNFNVEEELAQRSVDQPYILTHDEFFSSDRNSVTLTYFEGDNVLADERDEHVRDIDDTVGEKNLLRFGHGSKDNNIVYICNERLDVNFEVIRSPGKYAEEVLGFIEHSEKRKPPKFRRDDE